MSTMAPKPKRKTTALGKRLLAIRQRLGISQREAGERVGVTMEGWHAWESRGKSPTKAHMKLIILLEEGKI